MNNYLEILNQAWQLHLKYKEINAPTVISLFAGCGGSSLGYSIAGYKELLAVEWDKLATETFRLNFPEVPVYLGDIHKLSVDECLKLANISKGELDVLDGSPPCQGFSMVGKRKFADNRNQLYHEYVRLLRGLKPKIFIMENVSGLVKGKMKLIFADIMKELKASDYLVKCKLLNAKYYHVPQNRQRLIWLGIRNDLKFEINFPKGNQKVFTCKEVLCDIIVDNVPLFNDKYAMLWDKIPFGKNASIILHNKGFNGCVKLHPFKPAQTLCKLQTGHGFGTMVHWKEKRAISINEAKILQSFFSKFQLLGNYQQQWAQIGNSVPPLFMYHIANHVKALLGYEKEEFLNS
mgnify:FL=1